MVAMSSRGPTKVLLVTGSGRSGSTMLGNILGSVEGAFCGGELRYIWERGLRDNRLCGCSRPFRECPVWSAILQEAACEGVDIEGLIAGASRGTRMRHLPRLLLRRGVPPEPDPGDYLDHVARLYRAIPAVTGCSLVVDTSKLPPYGYLLGRLASIELFVVHLVRDPRATAYSWGREKALPDGALSPTMQRQSPAKSALLWDVWNVVARELWRRAPERYLRVGYEDLVARPQQWVERILEFAQHEGDPGPLFRGKKTVAMGVTHTVAGNPDRLRRGEVTLRVDEEWTRRMRYRDRILVTALTAPLLPGFAVRTPAAAPPRRPQ
jgi:hypothetical protein